MLISGLIKGVSLGGMLGWNTYLDIRYRQVSLSVVWVTIFVGGIWRIISKDGLQVENWLSLLPGMFFFLLALVFRGSIGWGDGWVLFAMGFFLSLKQILEIGMLAISLAGFVAIILVVFFHKKKKYAMPFVPFLLVAYVISEGQKWI